MFPLWNSTNHMYIGMVYIMSGFMGGMIGFTLSFMVRLELSLPGFLMCSSLQYNCSITFHGIFMMFFMMMPVLMGGFGNMLIPLMLCSCDMMFPSLNVLSLWLLLNSYLMGLLSLFIDGGINCGWTFYVPLSMFNYSSIDFFMFSMHIIGLSSLIGSINLFNTMLGSCSLSILCNSLFITLFSWSIFCTSLLLIMTLPVLAVCITLIMFDSHFNTGYFIMFKGGDVLLFQHLFWFFGHPEVYMLMLPAFGLINESMVKYSQCMIYGSDSMMVAMMLISFIGSMVWGHHMFMVGFDINTLIYFTALTSIIAIPTGIKLLNWLATIWSGSFIITISLLFFISFLFSFMFGGMTGMMLANCIINTMLHDSFFVVAHFHYMLSLAAVYIMICSLFNYYSIITSLYLNNWINSMSFIYFFISSNIMFISMHSQGMFSFPRSICDYSIIYFKFNWYSYYGIMGILSSLSIIIHSLIY